MTVAMSEMRWLALGMAAEAEQAAAKHAPFNSRHEAKAVIEEEFDEFWDLVKLNPKKPLIHPTKGHLMTVEQWQDEMREELVQVGAMCLRAIHDKVLK